MVLYIILYRYRAPGVRKPEQSLFLNHAAVHTDSSFVCNGQQLICIKATDRNSTF